MSFRKLKFQYFHIFQKLNMKHTYKLISHACFTYHKSYFTYHRINFLSQNLCIINNISHIKVFMIHIPNMVQITW